MERVQSLLLRGNRVAAVEEAIACKDFATALLVASMCDPETYKRTAKAYAENVFVGGSPMHTIGMLFSGSIQVPPHASHGNFWGIGARELKITWKKHLAAIISNRIVGWDRVALSLGDRLREVDDVQAAHFCYMVCGCPVTNPTNGDTRMALLGSDHRETANMTLMATAAIEAFNRTEAYEWAKRRGNKNAAIKSLQPFKVIFATLLTEYGLEDEAGLYALGIRHCAHISAASAKSFSGNSWIQIFEDQEAFAGSFAALEKRLGLDDPSSEPDPPVSPREEASSDQSIGEEHRDVMNSRLNQTDIDDTFVTAASNLMDNPGFSVSPEKAELPSLKQACFPSTGQTTSELSRKPAARVSPKNDFRQIDQAAEQSPSKLSSVESQKMSSQVAPAVSMPPRMQGSLNAPTGLPPMQTPTQIPMQARMQTQTPLAAVTPKDTKRTIEKAPNTAPSVMVGVKKDPKSDRKKAPFSAERSTRSGGLFSRLRTGLIRRFNPDATECLLPDNEEQPYYDKERKVWVFPGEDPADVAAPIAPPPIALNTGDAPPAPAPSKPATNDPLAAMMAPPTRKPASLRRGPSASTPGGGYPGMMSPMSGMGSPAAAGGAPPQFAVFTPAKKEGEKADK